MNKKIVVISTSMRANSNSEALAKSFTDGASNEGNDVEFISLKDKQVGFCKGCLVCQQTGNCVIKDDVKGIMDKVIDADIVVWATPIYYYVLFQFIKFQKHLVVIVASVHGKGCFAKESCTTFHCRKSNIIYRGKMFFF